MKVGDVVVFQLGPGVKRGIVVKINDQTIHAKLKNGSVIKRHLTKHVLEAYDRQGTQTSSVSDS